MRTHDKYKQNIVCFGWGETAWELFPEILAVFTGSNIIFQ